jgi:hypothetical protein
MSDGRNVINVHDLLGDGTMRQQDEQTNNSRQSTQAPAAVSDSSPIKNQHHPNHRSHHALSPKRILNGTDLCSRFDQISGQGLPKRMTTGKFVYLGPTDHLPDSPL